MVDVHVKKDIDKALIRVLKKIRELSLSHNKTYVVLANDKLLLHTRLQALFNFKFESALEKMLFELILTHTLAAERLGPGGFDRCVEMLFKKIDLIKWGDTLPDIKKNIEGILVSGTTIPKLPDVDWLIETHITSGTSSFVKTMLRESLDLIGFGGKIIVEKTEQEPSIELTSGYCFTHFSLWKLDVKLVHPKIVCIDGFVESVSELHHILTDAYDTQVNVVLVARGFADDVMQTLRVNYDRGTLKVVPVLVKFDFEGLNTLNDISIVSGVDLISSNKGDLITSIDLKLAPNVEQVTIKSDRLIIKNRSTRQATSIQVRELRKRRSQENNDDIGILFDKRIKSLSPGHVVIRLTDDKDFVVNSQAIDYVLRAMKSLIEHGTVIESNERMLVTTLLAAEVHSHRCIETLRSLGAMITLE